MHQVAPPPLLSLDDFAVTLLGEPQVFKMPSPRFVCGPIFEFEDILDMHCIGELIYTQVWDFGSVV